MAKHIVALTYDDHLPARHSVLPIVMGARPGDYEKVAPHNSYIHVDQFRGPRDLAEYLLELDRDDKKYNQYFQVQKDRKVKLKV